MVNIVVRPTLIVLVVVGGGAGSIIWNINSGVGWSLIVFVVAGVAVAVDWIRWNVNVISLIRVVLVVVVVGW